MKPRKPLKRSTKPIRKVSKKRASQLRDYSKLRKEFLSKHKWCQVWLAEHNLEEKDVRESEDGRGWATPPPMRALKEVPFAIEVHHRAGRFGKRLNDPDFWLAVCRESHNWIHNNPGKAREKGYLTEYLKKVDDMGSE